MGTEREEKSERKEGKREKTGGGINRLV